MLDSAAKASYLQSLKDLRTELEEAERSNDYGRTEKIREEMNFIESELTRAIGLRGRDRRAASAAERARLSVSRAIKTALARIAEEDAELGRLLGTAIHTGNFCSYRSDPSFRINWRL
jgi:non-specific serine/threonine protein kinase